MTVFLIYDNIICKDIPNIMTDNNLINLRGKINELDSRMLDLIDKRSQIVTEIRKFKDKNKSFVDSDREQEILDRLLSQSQGLYSKDSIIRIWRELFEASSRLQEQSSLAITTKRSIENIEIYKGGKATIASSKRIDGQTNIVKLSSNESAFGPSQKILSSTWNHNLNRYPEISGITLREEIAKLHQLEKDQIILGCGSDETLLFAALSFCQSGDEIIHAEHGFEMYPIIAKIIGAISKLAKEDNYKISVQSVCDQLTPATKVIYIANPNNPSGTYLSKKEIRELQKEAREKRVNLMNTRDEKLKEILINKLSGGIRDFVTNKTVLKAKTLLTKVRVSKLNFEKCFEIKLLLLEKIIEFPKKSMQFLLFFTFIREVFWVI